MSRRTFAHEIEAAIGIAREAYPDADQIKVCRAYGGEIIAEIRQGRHWKLAYTGIFLGERN